jgi:hypothetical protein
MSILSVKLFHVITARAEASLIPESFRLCPTVISSRRRDAQLLVPLLNPILGFKPVLRFVLFHTERFLRMRGDSKSVSQRGVSVESGRVVDDSVVPDGYVSGLPSPSDSSVWKSV